MKISFSTLSCPEWSWDKIVDEASDLGYDGIEVRGVNGEMFLPKAEPFLPENISGTMEDLRVRGLVITDLGSSVQFHDPENYDFFLSEGKAYIDLAQKLKVPYVRLFGNNIPDPLKKHETFDIVSRGIKELCSYCEGKNVMCILETHGDFSDLESLMPVLEMVNSPHLGLLWDIAHTYKVYGDDTSEFLETAWKYIKHVHIKDEKKVGSEYKLCRIGQGDVSVAKIISLLKERNFTGFISLEWEKKWVPYLEEPEIVLPEYIDFVKKYI